MATDDTPRGEPLSDETLRSYGELADELEGDGLEGAAIALDQLGEAWGEADPTAELVPVMQQGELF